MSYVTLSELRSLLDPNGAGLPAASLPDATLNQCISNAESEINARLSTRYQVPITVTPTPALLKRIALGLAAYHAQLAVRGTVDLEERDPYQLRYNAALALLADIVAGRANLPVDPPQSAQVGELNNVTSVPFFDIEDFELTESAFHDQHQDHRGRWVFDRG